MLGKNLSCYQCIKVVNEECDQRDLLPCASNFDRCVTHISKDGKLKMEQGSKICTGYQFY